MSRESAARRLVETELAQAYRRCAAELRMRMAS